MTENPFSPPSNAPEAGKHELFSRPALVSLVMAASLLPIHVATNLYHLLSGGRIATGSLIVGNRLVIALAVGSMMAAALRARREPIVWLWLIPVGIYVLMVIAIHQMPIDYNLR